MTKYIIIQGDGMADWRQGSPDGKTPLEAARTPNFDRLAGAGLFGMTRNIPAGMPPGSDVGNMALFGYDPQKYYTGRSPLEALAMGVKLAAGDVAFRMNLVCLREENGEEIMDDYSGGHVDVAHGKRLVAALHGALGKDGLEFHAGLGYRHLMVWRGGKHAMRTTPPHDLSDKPIAASLPQGEGAEALLQVMRASRQVLAPLQTPDQLGKGNPRAVTQVWLWGQGLPTSMDDFQTHYGLKAACITAVDVVRGVAVGAGATLIRVPGATGYLDTDYAAKGQYALNALNDHDLVYVHIEAPDESGHMGDRQQKIRAIEQIDEKIVGPMLAGLSAPFHFLVTCDHATPLAIKTHSPEPVPFALASDKDLGQSRPPKKYCEQEATASGVLVEAGHTLIERMKNYGGS